MKLAVIGTGYVGLVSGTCFAESGNTVTCVDNNPAKIGMLKRGEVPIYEPGLAELVERNQREERLLFTTQLAEGVNSADLIFICVGTPPGKDGSADLSGLWAVADGLASACTSKKLVVIKSTVPVGTNYRLGERLASKSRVPFEVASNPEFLKEGAALDDFMKPDRVVVGVRSTDAADRLRTLHSPFLRTEHPFLVMTPESAEMTKYVANAMLATKISFINEMANLCEQMKADIDEVRRGIGHDSRIGFQFLFPGPGYGGSCFPKDVLALCAMGRELGTDLNLLQAVHLVNEAQKRVLSQKIRRHFGEELRGKTLAVWGLAFKPRTDDIREAPSLVLIDELLEAGVALRVHDPEALANVRALYGTSLTYCEKPYDALEQADGLVIVTEWQEFRNPDFARMASLLRGKVIFDGRNLYNPAQLCEWDFRYYGIGRM
jgi:UDPglucose 6-dehydrogenase